MKKSVRLIVLFVGVIVFAHSAYALDESWSGNYEWIEVVGTHGPGLGVVVEYEIKVESENGGFKAVLHAEGYQTDETILCNVVTKGTSLDLLFSGYPNGKILNKYGVKEYEKGQRLLTLKKSNRKILTYWGALGTNTKPIDGKVYFEKK